MGPARRLIIVGVLATLTAGCTATVAGHGEFLGAGPAAGSTSESSSPPGSGSPPATETSPGETTSSPEPTSAAPTSSTDELTDDDWVVDSVDLSADALDQFSGTAQLRNTADRSRSAVFTLTAFVGTDQVATLLGTVADVGAGQTATSQLLSTDDFVAGPYRFELSVDFSF